MTQETWIFGKDVPAWILEKHGAMYTDSRLVNSRPTGNPCVAVFGLGPDGVTCKGCSHLQRRGGGSRTFLKCDLRPRTRGLGTDHRAGWPACRHYAAKESPKNSNV